MTNRFGFATAALFAALATGMVACTNQQQVLCQYGTHSEPRYVEGRQIFYDCVPDTVQPAPVADMGTAPQPVVDMTKPAAPQPLDCHGFTVCGAEGFQYCADTDRDTLNCGACRNICPIVKNGQGGCAASMCRVIFCNPGFDDCDKDVADGCEVNLNTDSRNCGWCGNSCGLASCQDGKCVVPANNNPDAGSPPQNPDMSKLPSPDMIVLPTCSDKQWNGKETDTDCGWLACGAFTCADGRLCQSDFDCQSEYCLNGQCRTPTCNDGLNNGFETDVDCGGGICNACVNGRFCLVASDCLSGFCDNAITGRFWGKCAPAPTCNDGVQSQFLGETDVDCGGKKCAPCSIGKSCLDGPDCQSGFCTNKKCAPAPMGCGTTCNNVCVNLQTDPNNCGQCTFKCTGGSLCVFGQTNDFNNRCACPMGQNFCNGVCQIGPCPQNTCVDGIRNGGETDVDCGGANLCPRCGNGRVCVANSDCASNVCVGGVCQPFRCPGVDIDPGVGTTKLEWWSGPVQGQAANVQSTSVDMQGFTVPSPRSDVCSVVGRDANGAVVTPKRCRGTWVNGRAQNWRSASGYTMQTGVAGCNIDANSTGVVSIELLDGNNNPTGGKMDCTRGVCACTAQPCAP